MKSKRLIKLSLVGLIAMPISIFFSNEILANNLNVLNQEILLAMGGGHGGGHSHCGGGNKPGVLKKKKATAKLNWKKRQLVKAEAAGEDTSLLLFEIAELEAIIAEKY